MSKSNAMINLPDALKTKPLATISTMNVETNILDPITFSNNSALFVLQNKGILDAGSRITFSVTSTAAASEKMFLYGKTGIASLIERAVLRVGSNIVAETNGFNHYETIRKQFKTQEELLQKDSVKCGYWASGMANASGGRMAYMAGVDNSLGVANATQYRAYEITNDPETTAVFSIGLSELFPMMFSVQLPLFVMAQPVSIELTFATQGASGNAIAGADTTVGGTDKAVVPNKINCQFLSDTLTYDDGRMMETAKIVASDNGLTYPYEDIVLTEATIPAVADPGAGAKTDQEVVRDVGLTGQSVRTLLVADTDAAADNILGPYVSSAFVAPDSFNLVVNDEVIYNRPVVNECRRQNELSQVFNTDINVSQCEFSFNSAIPADGPYTVNNPLIDATATFEGHNQNTVQAKNHYNGINLSTSPFNEWGSGIEIGQKPLRLLRTLPRGHTDFGQRNMKVWAMCEKAFNLKNGVVSVTA